MGHIGPRVKPSFGHRRSVTCCMGTMPVDFPKRVYVHPQMTPIAFGGACEERRRSQLEDERA
jgi:hypothetical protein